MSLLTIENLFRIIAHRISAAISTFPNVDAWLYTAMLLLLFTVVTLPIGFQFGFLKTEFLRVSWSNIIAIIASSLFMPAITEELFFRVLLLPQSTENVSPLVLLLWGCISLVLFIVYHPLNAVSFFPNGRETFFNAVFLVSTALLGLVCSLAYVQSGSLWTAVALHWLTVVVWLLLLGGYRKLY
ncbi:MAG TPA: CPBP family glutamic-type intramembrane protease [Coleofasciculaceae cyanobacterium]|jgi:predicted Abi (CAAX) family protease